MSKIIELLAHYPPYQLVHAAEMVRDTFEQFYQQRYQLTVPQWRLMMGQQVLPSPSLPKSYISLERLHHRPSPGHCLLGYLSCG